MVLFRTTVCLGLVQVDANIGFYFVSNFNNDVLSLISRKKL